MIVTIKGSGALLQHKYTTEEERQHNPFTDYSGEWITATHWNKDSNGDPKDKYVVIPQDMIMGSLYNACKGERLGKVYLTRVVHTSIRVVDEEYPLLYKGKEITLQRIRSKDWIDKRGVVVRGNRVDRSRTRIPKGWTLRFNILCDRPFDKTELLKNILQKAGSSAGFGDWRPSAPKPGPYGTFKLVSLITDGGRQLMSKEEIKELIEDGFIDEAELKEMLK